MNLFHVWHELQAIELKWIQQLHALFRSSFLDYFFLLWNYVDTFPFMMILIAVAWFLINRRVGIQLLFVFLLSSVMNGLLKDCFGLPRPCQLDPTVGVLHFTSPGFPSGAAQTAAIIAGVSLIEFQRKSFRYLVFLFALLLCVSRVYLGLHYFTDILGGLIVGSLLVVVYWGLYFLKEKQELKLFMLFSILLFIADPSKFIVQSGLLFGASFGLFIDNKNPKTQVKKDLVFRGLEGLCALTGLFILSALKDIYPSWKLFFTFAEGFWFSYMGGKLFAKLISFLQKKGIMESNSNTL